jgi:hypothetical protein
MSDFLRLLLFNTGAIASFGEAAGTSDRFTTTALGLPQPQLLPSRGSGIATTELQASYTVANFPKWDELLMTTIAHELVHQLIDKRNTGAFNEGEHTTDANGVGGPEDADDLACLMSDKPARQGYELATVKFFPVVLRELSVKLGEWVVE